MAPPRDPRNGRRVSPMVVTLYVLGVAEVLYYVALLGSKGRGMTPDGLDVLIGVGTLVMFAFGLLGIVWLGGVFRRMPIPSLEERMGGDFYFNFFIFIYNLFWMFAVTKSACDVLDRGLVQRGRPQSAPRILAMMACSARVTLGVVTSVGKGSFLAFAGVVTPILWMVFMYRIEASLRALSDAVAAEEA